MIIQWLLQFFSVKQWRLIIIFAIVGALLITGLLIVVFFRQNANGTATPSKPMGYLGARPSLNLNDFKFPDTFVPGIEDFEYSRQPKESWNDQDVEQFWIKPEQANEKMLNEINDELWQNYFNQID